MRDREVQTVRDVVEARATARVAAIVGEAGVGKSALAGARVDDQVLGPLRSGLGALLPGTVDASLDGATFPLVAAEALLALIATLDKPVILALDDLHWADADSLEALERICDRVATRAVTVLLVTRPRCPAEGLARRMASRRLGPVVDLHALDPDGAVAMATQCLGATVPDGIPSLIEGAGGKPFLIEELLRPQPPTGPRSPALPPATGWERSRRAKPPVRQVCERRVPPRLTLVSTDRTEQEEPHMSATENTALVQKLVGAFQTGDLATVASCFSPDAVWDFPGRSVVSGTFKGPEEIVAFLARSYELSGATLAVDLIDMRALELLHHEISGGAIVRTWHRSDEGAIAAFFGED